MTTLPIASAYRDAVRVALLVQIFLTVFLSLLLDFGVMAKIGGCAMIGFWIGAAIIVVRRPRDPRPIDLLYIRWGYLAMLILGMFIAEAIGHFRG